MYGEQRGVDMIFDQSVSITIPADPAWVPLAQAAAENGARVFDLDPAKMLRLTMGVEELLLHLAGTLPGREISITIRGRSTFVAVEAEFESVGTDLSALNITASVGADEHDMSAAMPLLLASRMTDGFHVERLKGKTRISLTVDRVYPETEVAPVVRRDVRGELSIVHASEPAMILEACAATRGLYPVQQIPVWFKTPGKVADMVAAGEINMLFAVDASDAICGMICWETPSEGSAAFFGPYSFADDKAVSGRLMEEMIMALGRTSAKIVFSNIATEDMSQHGFERLGEVNYHAVDGAGVFVLPVWFRQLREDFGASVWAHGDLIPYLEKKYDEHVVMRTIRPTADMGERVVDASVFSTRLSRDLSEVVLRPMLNGNDNAVNLKRHVETLCTEGFKNIFFFIDLSLGWQAALGADLLANNFIPALLLPHGGQSDVVIFQYVEPSA
jgi:hypothetical protein